MVLLPLSTDDDGHVLLRVGQTVPRAFIDWLFIRSVMSLILLLNQLSHANIHRKLSSGA